MDNKRFFNLFNLTEDQAIALLDTPQDQLNEEDSRYIAASHLVNFNSERSIQALIRAVLQTDSSLDNRIVRRKSIETLGRLSATQALSVIRTCLVDDDCYTVENAVWAIGEIGTKDPDILEEVAQLLDKPGQTYRVIIHTLTKLLVPVLKDGDFYQPAVERIRKFVEDGDPPTQSAAISAICRFTGDTTGMQRVVELLQHPNVMTRRLSIQDLIDAQYYDAIPQISQTPVSLVFRLRGIRMLAEAGVSAGILQFTDIQPYLEQTLRDHPSDLDLVHAYDKPPTLEFLVRELYETDFGRCYLATQTILEHHADAAPPALFATYEEEAYNDYGAHFHVMKLFGWMKHAPAYDLLVSALHNKQPQFQKSRAAAAIALGELGDLRAIAELKTCLLTKIWDLKYAALMALEQLGDSSGYAILALDDDWLIREKANLVISH
jgi:bilin biosynthesis protein